MRLALLITAIIPTCLTAQVDGFNKGKGNMDLVLSAGYEIGFDYYLSDDRLAGIKRNRGTASFFAARGITNTLDVQLNIPFGVGSLQDGNAFVKWLPLQADCGKGSCSFGAAVGGSTPLANYNTEGLTAIGQQATSASFLGVAQFKTDGGTFASLVGGYTAVRAPTPDALVGTFRIGRAASGWYGECYVQAQRANGGKNYRGVGEPAPTTFKELGVDFVKAGAKYYRPLSERFGWVLDVNYAVAGRNADQNLLVAGSIIMHFRKGRQHPQ